MNIIIRAFGRLPAGGTKSQKDKNGNDIENLPDPKKLTPPKKVM